MYIWIEKSVEWLFVFYKGSVSELINTKKLNVNKFPYFLFINEETLPFVIWFFCRYRSLPSFKSEDVMSTVHEIDSTHMTCKFIEHDAIKNRLSRMLDYFEPSLKTIMR